MSRDGIEVPADQSWSENPAYTTTARTVRPRAIRPASFMMASNRPRTKQHFYPIGGGLKHRVKLSLAGRQRPSARRRSYSGVGTGGGRSGRSSLCSPAARAPMRKRGHPSTIPRTRRFDGLSDLRDRVLPRRRSASSVAGQPGRSRPGSTEPGLDPVSTSASADAELALHPGMDRAEVVQVRARRRADRRADALAVEEQQ